jgi:hypothetical protein
VSGRGRFRIVSGGEDLVSGGGGFRIVSGGGGFRIVSGGGGFRIRVRKGRI